MPVHTEPTFISLPERQPHEYEKELGVRLRGLVIAEALKEPVTSWGTSGNFSL